jgi:hypothetical protein
MDEKTKLGIMEECPRFTSCSVNRCPLDIDIRLRNELTGEERCTMAKTIRVRIGKKHNLPKLGMTNPEFAGYTNYQKLTPEEKEKMAERGRLTLKKLKSRSSHS